MTSSSGTSAIDVGDTIRFEITVTTNAAVDYAAVIWHATGDLGAAVAVVPSFPNWPGGSHIVSNWEWNYAAGSKVNMSTATIVQPFLPVQAPGFPVSGFYGFEGQVKTGGGVPALIGTVTIVANAAGVYEGGATPIDGFSGFVPAAGGPFDTVAVTGASFTVAPEPSPALLLGLGLAGIVGARRFVA